MVGAGRVLQAMRGLVHHPTSAPGAQPISSGFPLRSQVSTSSTYQPQTSQVRHTPLRSQVSTSSTYQPQTSQVRHTPLHSQVSTSSTYQPQTSQVRVYFTPRSAARCPRPAPTSRKRRRYVTQSQTSSTCTSHLPAVNFADTSHLASANLEGTSQPPAADLTGTSRIASATFQVRHTYQSQT